MQTSPQALTTLSDTLAQFGQHRPTLTALLKQRAYEAYRRERRPVSVNDVRRVLDEQGYRGDPRILASAYPRSEWRAVGYTDTNSERAHARSVRTFVPRDPSKCLPEHREVRHV